MLRYGCLFALVGVPLVAGAAPDRVRLRRAASQELSTLGTSVVVVWPPHRLRPAMIRGLAVKTRGPTDEARARAFLTRHPALFAGSGSTLALRDVQATYTRRVVRFQHRYRGLPVFGAAVAVVLDRGGVVRAVSSEMEPIAKLASIQPRLAPVAAVRAVQRKLSLPPGQRADSSWAQLGMLPGSGGTARLVYRVALPPTMDRRIRWHLIDASSGEYVGWRRAAASARGGQGRSPAARWSGATSGTAR